MPGKIAKEGASELDCEVIAKCPKCGGLYSVVMPWTGRGMPRRYCAHCRHYSGIEKISTIPDHGPAELGRWSRMGWV